MYFEEPNRASNKKKIIIGTLGVIAVVGVIATIAMLTSRPTLSPMMLIQAQIEEQEFQSFIDRHNKNYADETEYNYRFRVYKDNAALIRRMNQEKRSYTLALNQFADLTNAEFREIYANNQHFKTVTREEEDFEAPIDLPSSVDWRKHGAVTSIKNQGQCGSCWAFSTAEGVEGVWALAGHSLVSLSEQELVDCSGSYGNDGCDGGLMDYGFQYVMKYGLTSYSNYPYTARDGSCDNNKVAQKVATISGYTDVPQNNPDALKTAIVKNPVSVAVDAGGFGWQFYFGGVVTVGECGTELDHGVLAVGYDTTASTPYYIVKNSWGASWGMDGYIELEIASGAGTCGIQKSASYPHV